MLERGTADELYLLVVEELVGGDVVEAALDALDSDAFHLWKGWEKAAWGISATQPILEVVLSCVMIS